MAKKLALSAVFLTGMGGCGAAPTAQGKTPTTPSAPSEPGDANARDNLAVSGLLGMLTPAEIQRALDPRLPKFSRCFQRRLEAVEWLSGTIELAFRIAVDGRVARVDPVTSDLGDRDTERCILELAASTHFPAPHGGEAEFSWPLTVPLDSEVRPPVAYDALDAARTALTPRIADCGPGPFVLTAYVNPEGAIVAAGVAGPVAGTSGALDCVASNAVGALVPSPGSYTGKLRLELP